MGAPKHNTNAVPKQGHIANFVKMHATNGLGFPEIFGLAKGKGFQYCPRSITTFRKLYYEDYQAAHSEVISEIGQKVLDAARAGDYKPAELFLTTHSPAWMKKSAEFLQVQESDPEDDASAMNALMTALGLSDSDDDEEEN